MIDKSKIPELNQALREINIELKKVRLKFNDLLEKRREKLIKKKEIIVNKIKTRENQVIKSPTNSKTLIREDPLWKNYDEIKKKILLLLCLLEEWVVWAVWVVWECNPLPIREHSKYKN